MNEKNQFIAQVCHIEAAAPGGERYSPNMTDEARRRYENLMLLCYRHHIETNSVEAFPVAFMRRMKELHEARFQEFPFRAADEVVAAIAAEAVVYWKEVARKNQEEHVVPSLRIEIDTAADATTLFSRARGKVRRLESMHEMLRQSDEALPQDVRNALSSVGYDLGPWNAMPYWNDPTDCRHNFEVLNIGLRNVVAILTVLIDQLEIRHLETAVLLREEHGNLLGRLEELRAHVFQYAAKIGYVD